MSIRLHNITHAMHLALSSLCPYLLVGSLLFARRDWGWGLSLVNAVLWNIQGSSTVVGRSLGVALTHFLRTASSPSRTLAGAGWTHPLVARYLFDNQRVSCSCAKRSIYWNIKLNVNLHFVKTFFPHYKSMQRMQVSFQVKSQLRWNLTILLWPTSRQAKGHVP